MSPNVTHTPGNWTFDEGSGEVSSDIDEHGFLVATVESNDADGPAIAAAPDMKAALSALVEAIRKRPDLTHHELVLIGLADRAIAKSEGRE